MNRFFAFWVDRPKLITGIMIVLTVVLALVATLPSLWPQTFPFLSPARVDTDPENMLSREEAVRVFHHQMKREFSLYDMVVLGIVNEKHPEGVFNPESLRKIYELTEYAKTLRWPDKENPDRQVGVVEIDLLAPSTVDNIEQGGLGTVRFEWLMPAPPKTEEEALAIRRKAERIPFLQGTLLSEDGKAIALYLPLTSKDLSYRVATKLREKIATFQGDERYFITGLPVAEDTFGVEMFKEMAISAPLAMLVIFVLMLYFFRKLVLILSPMIVALVSVIWSMGLLVATGNTIHIMSSMIPIFIVPIAVLDAIHILSEFFDRYQETRDRRTTILRVMETLYMPMLYTSLTTAAGFASLALTPIPPVQVFGLFVALGVMLAWIWTVTFIPASVMFIRPEKLENFGLKPHEEAGETGSLLSRLLPGIGRLTYRYAKVVLLVTALISLVAIYGIFQININDNPTKWFKASHPIRIADKVLNEHFGGTYMAYLALEAPPQEEKLERYVATLSTRLKKRGEELQATIPEAGAVFARLQAEALQQGKRVASREELLEQLATFADDQSWEAPEEQAEAWNAALLFLDQERQQGQVFKQPEVLRYIAALQQHLLTTGIVGKSNSLADIVKTVHRELFLGKEEQFRIPDSASAVAQTLITYQNSHRPQDLWHFVTPDYRKTSIWVQLKSGDNRDMSRVVQAVERFMAENPPPLPLTPQWFGLTYINVVWQEKMVSGMLQAFLGSFLVVLLMMIALFRSALWGLLSMVPLTVTIGLIYGTIGLIGKDYDMPVAVLSSLSLGLAVDYAIHFLARSRVLQERYGSWKEAIGAVFGEPARAITRNVIVVGVGFLPLLAAPLVPYQTVGTFIAAILVTAGVASLLLLPALITLLERWLFPQTAKVHFTCNCATCIVSAVTAIALVAVNIHQFLSIGWTRLTLFSLIALPVLIGLCTLMSWREKCKRRLKIERW
ncbi:MAG: RND transporter [Nitrospinota bacterium]|nr:MAG: RND transporter [Nitrospinota bacterium]